MHHTFKGALFLLLLLTGQRVMAVMELALVGAQPLAKQAREIEGVYEAFSCAVALDGKQPKGLQDVVGSLKFFTYVRFEPRAFVVLRELEGVSRVLNRGGCKRWLDRHRQARLVSNKELKRVLSCAARHRKL